MLIPSTVKAIVEHLESTIQSSGSTASPPMILRGPPGVGKSWILKLLHRKLLETATSRAIPIWIPFKLNPEGLVDTIRRRIASTRTSSLSKNIGKETVDPNPMRLLFLDDIDTLFNFDSLQSQPMLSHSRAHGAGVARSAQAVCAAELRSFLIENAANTTLVATSGEDISFMSDQDLPFFNFFNIINVPTISFDESRHYLIRRTRNKQLLSRIDNIFSSINSSWIYHLTDGKILYLNFLADAVTNMENFPTSSLDSVADFLQSYFDWVSASAYCDLHRLSFYEKKLVDDAVHQAERFRPSDLRWEERKSSLLMRNLSDKGLLRRHGQGKTVEYSFSSAALKSYLRFRKQFALEEVIAPFSASSTFM
jgi:hypothetical protein